MAAADGHGDGEEENELFPPAKKIKSAVWDVDCLKRLVHKVSLLNKTTTENEVGTVDAEPLHLHRFPVGQFST